MAQQNNRPVAVVVTHNRRDMLMRCLDALGRQTEQCDIMVIDNASSDGTREAVLNRNDKRIAYVDTGSNLGGAGGFAFGIQAALDARRERIWIMDDDVIPSANALENLCGEDRRRNGQYGWLSSKCVMPNGRICPMNLQRATPFKKIEQEKLNSDNTSVPSQMASFVSLFFRAETVRRFALPFAEFFIWSDDLEWTRRISLKLPCFTVPASIVTHAISGTAASNIALDTPERIPRYFYAFRNEFFVYRREGIRGIVYYTAKTALNFARILFRARDRRRERLNVLLSGVIAGISFKPRISTEPTKEIHSL